MEKTIIAESHWTKCAGMTVLDYQYSQKDYITNVFPRAISGWFCLSVKERQSLTEWEKVRHEAWKLENPKWVDIN